MTTPHPPRYMLDTNMCIYLMKHAPAEVAAKFAQCYVGEVVMSSITLAEMEYGVEALGEHSKPDKAKAQKALKALTQDILVQHFDVAAAHAYGKIRLATRERKRDALDKLIAAHAVALNLTLVTNNLADFAAYPKLKLENWVDLLA